MTSVTERHQAVVIGAGAGGAAMAWSLASRGVEVLLLEAGPSFDPERDYLLHTEGWEKQRFPHKPNSQGRYRFARMQTLEPRWNHLRSWNRVRGLYNTGDHRQPSGPGYHHVRGVGGSTLHFTGEAHRLHPESMTMRSRFQVAADWPLSYADLEPWYQEAEALVGVAGPEQPGARWRSQPYPLPAHPLSKASAWVAEGCRKGGFDWQANPRAALSRPYDGRPNCNYCANCLRGCPRRDKGSADVTFIAKAQQLKNFELRANSPLLSLVTGSNGRIQELRYLDDSGAERALQADIIILAAGAIETPRLLLASASRHAPQGVANESRLVGKNLMETLSWSSNGIAQAPIESFKGLPADTICWDFNAPDAIPNQVGGCRFGSSVSESDLLGPIAYATRILPGWGKAHKQALRKLVGQAVNISAIGESLPNPQTFVDLDPEARDEHGLPLARIHCHLPESELRRLEFMRNTCRKMLALLGVEEIVEEYGAYDYFSATHIFGTCRMGHDPKTSVTDALGRCHHWKNLFISDASLFPSSGGGESPSLTIEALALRSGEQIARQLGHQGATTRS